MESAHPPLSESDGAAQILLRGTYDAVSLAEVRYLVGVAEPEDVPYLEREPVALRESSLATIDFLVRHDLARLGDLERAETSDRPGRAVPVRFVPWPLTGGEAIERVRREWWDPQKDLRPGDICWLENTPAGDEVARRLEAERGGSPEGG